MNKTYVTIKLANGNKVDVAEWVVNKNANAMLIADLAAGLLEIAKETEKAIFFKGTFGGFWAPKNQILNY